MMRFVPAISLSAVLWRRPRRCDPDHPQVVEIWPGKAPEEPGTIGAEYVRMSPQQSRKQVEVTESTRMVTNVTQPTHHHLSAGQG